MKKLLLISACLFFATINFAQEHLKPGFDPDEYADVLSLAFFKSSIPDSTERMQKKDPYKLIFQSEETGLHNLWRLYLRNDGVAVIDVRGTVQKTPSWLENFYAATIPATGSLILNDSTTFNYQLSADPKAMVHTGWTIGLCHLAPSIVEKINALYKEQQVKEFILSGHSQGAAITFLLRSYLHYTQQKGFIPADVQFKTYCSAAPKPGNLFYAYDYDFITRGGWGLTVVNAADWVPETPFSVQTFTDFNKTNPTITARATLKKQKFLIRLAGNTVVNSMERSTRKADKKLKKYLGKTIYKQVKKSLPQLKQPAYSKGMNYMRAGTPVILMPDESYYQLFPDKKETLFIHHMFQPYYYLLKKWYKLKSSN